MKTKSDTVVTSYLMMPTTSSTFYIIFLFLFLIFLFFYIFLSPWHLGLLLGHPLAGQDLLHLLDSRPLVLGLLEVRGREDGLGVAHAQSQCSNKITWSASTNLRPEVWRESNVVKWGVEVKSRLPLSCNRGWRWLLKSTCFPRPGWTILQKPSIKLKQKKNF